MANLHGETYALLFVLLVSLGLQIEFLCYLFGDAHAQLAQHSTAGTLQTKLGTDCDPYRACYQPNVFGIAVSALPDFLCMVLALASLHGDMFARNQYQLRIAALGFTKFAAFIATVIAICCRATPAMVFQSVPLAWRLHGPEALAGERGYVVGAVIVIVWRALTAALLFIHHPSSGKVVDVSGHDEIDEEEIGLQG